MNLPLWFADLLFWSVQVAVLALAAALFVKILRIREPRALLVCWRTLVGASLLLPLVEPWRRVAAPVVSALPSEFSIPEATSAAHTTVSHWQFPSWATIAEILGAVIAAGILVRLVMLALGLLKLRQLRRKSAAIAADAPCAAMLEETRALVGGSAEFRLSGEVESPVTFGLARPLVLLPEKFLALEAPFQAAIACHELLHVRRRDWAHHLGEEVLRAIFWFHPAILWLVARVRLAREQVVDLEVVRLTAARKTYVEALLEFTSGRRVAAIPAPPFLAEQQFVERVALMLKEAGMSRRRLIASLSVIGCGLVGAAVLAVSVFPLKAAPRRAVQAAGEMQATQAASQPVVSANSIWTDTVKRGNMTFAVRGLGTLTLLNGKPIATVELPETQAGDVRVGQSVQVDTHKGIVKGHVMRVSLQVVEGNRAVFIALDSPVPSGVDPRAQVEGTIVVGKLQDVLYVGRPIHAKSGAQRIVLPIFKIIDNGKEAEQLHVEFGRVSVSTIQVLSGLKPGDTVILTDMSPYEKYPRVEIKHGS
jgi:beta-lactamase regulating signal transducer with metallopeptidase domain